MTLRRQLHFKELQLVGADRLRSVVARGATALASLFSTPALAQTIAAELPLDSDVVNFAFSGGLALFSAVVAIAHIGERNGWRRRETELAEELEDARARLDRIKTFMASEPQVFIAWTGPDSEPDVSASTLLPSDVAISPRRILAFGSWLSPKDAQELEAAVERLRNNGESFRLQLAGAVGRHFDADGRAVGGSAVLRIREVSGDRLELIGLRERHAETQKELSGLRALLEASPTPVWVRDADGRLAFVNSAYATAVEAKDPADAIARGLELLDQSARSDAANALAKGAVWRAGVPAVVAGVRHMLDVTQTAAPLAASIAIDRHEVETVRADLQQQMQSHVRTLDQLPTGVAIFDRRRRLVYHNDAYAKLWQLEPGFLDHKPTDGEILDRLRAGERVPVESDYKAWKERLFEAYRSPEPVRHTWHLPDGRIVDVVAHPNTQGGVTYLYDDTTKAYDLETRFNALNRTQSETLETLHEGVAVFGADGRLSFCNPAFAGLWRLDPDALAKKPRFEAIVTQCKTLHDNDDTWAALKGFVTSFNDMREGFTRRIERSDGMVLDCTAQSLLEGAALLTFVDVTADVNVERALTDRNLALIAAEKLRNDFIHHVSYELRSPLNNINGFVHLLGEESTGPLNPRQMEYLGYVSKSSAALLAIIDDILDLATIDEDAMELELSDVDVRATMDAAIEGVQDRLAENSIDVQIIAMDDIGTFRGDAKRVRQVLFNLLSNAIGFSRPGQTVTLAALRRANEVVLKVTDHGRGIPAEVLERVFERFESHTAGSRHRGVGLGLSIVRAFVELHGGKVLIDTAPGEGTTVTCVFPALAAEEEARLIAHEGGAE
ncbi:PAS-domain containing protein [Methylocystis sp. MJC1]|jgi:signal transduction histidine kinase|uniref:PAS domain-containing sensor histidine kinase n=1 Tax=Methylocystis sp. MJC1 TaxID=2654282 RepID=UPI0013EBD416|nr:PAS-domain containing protein [Methylocystis sp. MJC1]KAF2990181.1 Sensor protein DivL [Methylocystis sp. MJC1]MBU6527568.1 PAS-domain containing protein [Methylocystis sp. MJC1]UZX10507.1 PAS-domain containing protein [Methylocystis sp. MJC1]